MTAVDQRTPEEQFALLLDGELRPDEVGDDLRSLYALSGAVGEHVPLFAPEHRFRLELREQLLTAANRAPASAWERARDAVWSHTARLRNSVRAALASGVAASLIGTAGVAAAAQHALPGQLLYPVKELTESVRMGLAGDLAATGRLHLRFADERLDEVDEGAQELRPQLLIDTLEEMDEHSIDGAEDLLAHATRTADEAILDELRTFTQDQRTQLLDVMRQLPSAVVPFAEESLEVLRRIDLEIDGEPEPCACDEPEPPVDRGPVTEPTLSAPGEEPAGSPPRPCGCVPATDEPAPPREQPPVIPPPVDEPDEPAPSDPPAEDEPVDLIPELPGPLDDAGDVVDDLVNDVLDGTEPVTDPLPVDPEDDVVDPVDETIDGLLDEAPLSPSPAPSPSLGS